MIRAGACLWGSVWLIGCGASSPVATPEAPTQRTGEATVVTPPITAAEELPAPPMMGVRIEPENVFATVETQFTSFEEKSDDALRLALPANFRADFDASKRLLANLRVEDDKVLALQERVDACYEGFQPPVGSCNNLDALEDQLLVMEDTLWDKVDAGMDKHFAAEDRFFDALYAGPNPSPNVGFALARLSTIGVEIEDIGLEPFEVWPMAFGGEHVDNLGVETETRMEVFEIIAESTAAATPDGIYAREALAHAYWRAADYYAAEEQLAEIAPVASGPKRSEIQFFQAWMLAGTADSYAEVTPPLRAALENLAGSRLARGDVLWPLMLAEYRQGDFHEALPIAVEILQGVPVNHIRSSKHFALRIATDCVERLRGEADLAALPSEVRAAIVERLAVRALDRFQLDRAKTLAEEVLASREDHEALHALRVLRAVAQRQQDAEAQGAAQARLETAAVRAAERPVVAVANPDGDGMISRAMMSYGGPDPWDVEVQEEASYDYVPAGNELKTLNLERQYVTRPIRSLVRLCVEPVASQTTRGRYSIVAEVDGEHEVSLRISGDHDLPTAPRAAVQFARCIQELAPSVLSHAPVGYEAIVDLHRVSEPRELFEEVRL